MLHQTLPILGQLWQLFEVSQILEFLSLSELIQETWQQFVMLMTLQELSDARKLIPKYDVLLSTKHIM